ncbi:unnamed protein product [Pedinophyceae sp. YPF-701]|nr:unnamed protein product [Pedinophyceae sp. YPF-701]
MAPGRDDGVADAWREWLDASLAKWEDASLLRKFRPVEPTSSAVVVQISHDVRDEWLADAGGGTCGAPGCTQRTTHAHGAALDALSAVAPGGATPCTRSGVSAAPRPEQASNLVLFSSNDYLGLSSHEGVRSAVASSAARHGMGPRSSAIVAGYTAEHRMLERALADLKGTEDCVLCPTGFAANLAAIGALLARTDGSGGRVAVFSDELNHASIIDAVRLARTPATDVHVYRHNDTAHLDALLSASDADRKLVVTDSLFSMDGDFADLRGLARLRRKHGFMLLLDEAHATLVCGERGGGAAEMMGVERDVDVHVGTLSKAFGSQGGFVACSAALKTWIANRGRAFVYSTALPLPAVVAAAAALQASKEEPWRRTHVWSLARHVGGVLGVRADSPIIAVVVGDEKKAMALSARLLAQGMYVPAIRPPTVPAGTSRLRISLSAAHTTSQVDALLAAIQAGMRDADVSPVRLEVAQSVNRTLTVARSKL